AIAAATVVREPTSIARALRVTLALAALATPVALGAVLVTQAAPRRAAAAVFAACAASALAGLAASPLARRFASGGSRWLGPLEAAAAAASSPDPDTAMEAALVALSSFRGRAGDPQGGPGGEEATPGAAALFRLSPPERVTVD